MFHHMYIATGRGRQSIVDKILMTWIERTFLFAHMLQVSKWSLRNLILYTVLMILYKICHIPPKLKDSLYAAMHWGYKNKEKEQMYPQF